MKTNLSNGGTNPGHVKCGTSSMMEWLGTHPQIACIPGEVPLLPLGKIGLLAKRLYNGLDADPMKLRGFKNPTDIQNLKAIRLLREYFPQTKLLIGIRHPVLWFESFYNHRIQNTGEMPPPDKLMKGCFKGTQGVCGERAEFHKSLVRLGKTNYTQEKEAFTQKEWKNLLKDSPRKSPNPVFLYDTQQLADKDLARRLLFRQDMQNFLSLTEPFPELVHNSPGKSLNATEQAERDVKKLNICEEQHDEIRQTLMAKSKRSAYYIRSYFIHAPDVTVSSPDYFLEIMASYFQDPCILRNNATQ